MVGGRKKHRHTGPGYLYEGTYGIDKVDPALVILAERLGLAQGAQDEWERLEHPWDHESVPPAIACEETVASPPVTSPPVTSPPVTSPPVTSPLSPARPSVTDSLLARDQVEAVNVWRHEYPRHATYLSFLRQFESARFLKALESIQAGRGRSVAEALEPWYIQYRAAHGWDAPSGSDSNQGDD